MTCGQNKVENLPKTSASHEQDKTRKKTLWEESSFLKKSNMTGKNVRFLLY